MGYLSLGVKPLSLTAFQAAWIDREAATQMQLARAEEGVESSLEASLCRLVASFLRNNGHEPYSKRYITPMDPSLRSDQGPLERNDDVRDQAASDLLALFDIKVRSTIGPRVLEYLVRAVSLGLTRYDTLAQKVKLPDLTAEDMRLGFVNSDRRNAGKILNQVGPHSPNNPLLQSTTTLG